MNIKRLAVGVATSTVGSLIFTVAPAHALINTGDIANGAITTALIANSTIHGSDILNDTITTVDIMNGAVTYEDIANSTIHGSDILDDTLTTVDLADNAVLDADVSDNITIDAAVSRATGATGSFQPVASDLTLVGAAGGTGSFQAAVMGNLIGSTLTNTNASYHAGVVGAYSVGTSDGSAGPKAGVVGAVGVAGGASTAAKAAVMAVLDGGDPGSVITANAAYGVQYLNANASAKFTYGVDLSHAAASPYPAVSYTTADIRFQNGETLSNVTDGKVKLLGPFVQQVGTTIASATALPLSAAVGNVFTVSGTTNVTSATVAATDAGRVVTLIFSGILTFTDGNNLTLASSLTTTADDTITLVSDGTNWIEIARSVN